MIQQRHSEGVRYLPEHQVRQMTLINRESQHTGEHTERGGGGRVSRLKSKKFAARKSKEKRK